MNNFSFKLPTNIIFGRGVFDQAGEQIAALGKKAFIVTGATAMKKLGYTDKLVAMLKTKGVEAEVFDGVEANPSNVTIAAAVEKFNKAGCDAIVGLGGGSVLDAAKAIGVVAKYGGDARDYVGEGKVPGPIAPLVAIATTAGTGSEVTEYAVISDPKKKLKDAIASPYIYPTLAIVDPELMLEVSPKNTIGTGLDALAHAIEAYTSNLAQPISDAVALQAIELCGKHLVRAVSKPSDIEAREGMALASTLAGIAISHGDTTIAHVIGEAVGAVCNTPHGLTVGVVLPHVMKFNIPGNEERYAAIARALGADACCCIRDLATSSVEAVLRLMSDMGAPLTLKELGVTTASLPRIKSLAERPGMAATNPRVVLDGDMDRLIEVAFGD